MVVRNSKVLPNGLARGKSMVEINSMSIMTCDSILDSLNYAEAKKAYELGIDASLTKKVE